MDVNTLFRNVPTKHGLFSKPVTTKGCMFFVTRSSAIYRLPEAVQATLYSVRRGHLVCNFHVERGSMPFQASHSFV